VKTSGFVVQQLRPHVLVGDGGFPPTKPKTPAIKAGVLVWQY